MSADRTLGVAVIGTGFGCLTHARAFRAAGWDVRWLVGRDPERTATRATRMEIERQTTTLAEALADPAVDAVSVVTPPHTHSQLVLESVAAGKHVLCEKPFARDAADARAMLDAAAAAGVVHLVGTEFRWATGQELLRRVIRDGAIGTPRLATLMVHIPVLVDPAAVVPEWWSDADQGGGWLGALAPHMIDQVRSTLGEFDGVNANLHALVDRDPPWTVEDTFSIHFRLRSGVDGILQSSAADRGPIVFSTNVLGTDGTAWSEGDTVKVADANGTVTVPPPPDLTPEPADPPPSDLMVTAYDFLHSTGGDLVPYRKLITTFGDLIEGRDVPADPPPATFADGVATMAVIDAVRRSDLERNWITIDREL